MSQWLLLGTGLILLSCNSSEKPNDASQAIVPLKGKIYELISAEQSGVDFKNTITETKYFNYFIYDGIYQGAGVGVGDINNDGLIDLYFAGNQEKNRLYLNKGNLQFEDITDKAGVGDEDGWSTGVSMIDINQDGFLDIYVCRFLLNNQPDKTANLLYINNRDGTFTEKATEYGIADPGLSIQATFFDFDKDGDLDLYVVNQPPNHIDEKKKREIIIDGKQNIHRDFQFTDRLFENKGNNKFEDITASAGVKNSAYGLSAVVSDLNNDGWPDIYVACDYEEPDLMYINQQNKTFSDEIDTRTKHISNFSMGTDIADFNNDGMTDIYCVDMLARDNYRQKANMSGMNPDKFWALVETGFHYQYMHNSLQLNRGGAFSEIAQLAGLDKTDWSWSALFIDMDFDGYKDAFVTNGIKYDVRNKDFLHDISHALEEEVKKLPPGEMVDVTKYLADAPSTKLSNLSYRYTGDYQFENKTSDWGMDHSSFSNGAAYADLDNDGDLEIIINNVQDKAFIYKSLIKEKNVANSLTVKLEGASKNRHGLGARVYVYYDSGKEQMIEHTYYRGYMSSMVDDLHFGLGNASADSVLVIWPDGKGQMLRGLSDKSSITLKHSDAKLGVKRYSPIKKPLFKDMTEQMAQMGFKYPHLENEFNDYIREVLLPHKMSQFGPGIAVGDVDKNGLDDFFVGGSAGGVGSLFLQTSPYKFVQNNEGQPWLKDALSEDLGVLFFDADGDQDLDLYIVSGGNEFPKAEVPELQDRLYLNQGKGKFIKANDALPPTSHSGSCVVAEDYDQDGDLDLFVGGRVVPGAYPTVPRSYLLENLGGKFKDVTEAKAPSLAKIGLVSSAIWSDYDNDGDRDLLLAGEWMPFTIYQNNDGTFENVTEISGLERSNGWWNSISAGDFDNDGDMDYLLGNYGLNSKFDASYEEPLHVYSDDFDNNRSRDIVLAYYDENTCYPVRGRQCSSEQIPQLASTFPTYDQFAKSDLTEIYGADALQSALHHEAYTLASTLMVNQGNGVFEAKPLPVEAQISTVFGSVVEDFDRDGNLDVLLAGNFYMPEVETGRQDAFLGLVLKGDGQGGFTALDINESGIYFMHNDCRSLSLLSAGKGNKPVILVGNNSNYIQTVLWEKGDQKAPNKPRKQEIHIGSGYLSQHSILSPSEAPTP